jgi:endoglucanase
MWRHLALSVVVVVTALALAAAGAHARAPVPPLSTDGARIVDAEGRTAILQGVNWFGFETSSHVVHGLWTRDYRDVLAQIREAGFNTIRLPFSLEALESRTVSGIDFSAGKNAPLRGRTPLQALDAVIDAAARERLLILLDNHSLSDDAYQHPLWYGDGGYTEDDWVAAWRRLAARYAHRPNVVGADLKNEPHGPASWGTGGPADWRRAAERAGSAIGAIAPDWLIVVEGIEGRTAGQRLDRHWWGGNLEGVRRAPVRLPRAGRLVYSPHEYGPGVFPQPWFTAPDMARTLEHRWRTGFGYLVEQGIAPVLIGEWGGREVGMDTTEGRWQRQLMDYVGRTGISWTYWALNPNSGDTGGVLRDDWTTLNAAKTDLLQRLLRQERIPFGAGDEDRSPSHAGSPPADDSAEAPTPAGPAGDPARADDSAEAPTPAGPAGDPAADDSAEAPTPPGPAGDPAADDSAEAPTPAGPAAGPAADDSAEAPTAAPVEDPAALPAPAFAAPFPLAPLFRAPLQSKPLGSAPPQAGSLRASAPTASARAGAVVRLVVESRWNEGWCGRVEVEARAPLTLAGQAVTLRLSGDASVSQSWNAERRDDGEGMTLVLPEWARAAPGEPYTATGMCGMGTDVPARLTIR